MSSDNFIKLLSYITDDTVRPSTRGKRDILIATESDKGRVINSAAFRRLQQKAQVFPLESNAAVRTRLTHSIEVSQVGRYIAQKVIEKSKADKIEYPRLAAFVNTIDTACLLHDIGNPPFGHLGEAAIKEWFKKRSDKLKVKDLTEFDGNPQGFRMISFLNGIDDSGLNLTCTQLLSVIKYPWGINNKPEGKKIGLFSSDLANYEKCCTTLGWEVGKRFPFLFLMEASDDIAYSMSDLEDGLEKNILSIEYLYEKFGKEKFKNDKVDEFVWFKTGVINAAVDHVATNFVDRIDEILEGNNIKLIDEDSEVGILLNEVSSIAREKVYSHEDAEKVELAGRSIIKGLLNHFEPLLTMDEVGFNYLVNRNNNKIKDNNYDFEKRMFNLLPKKYVQKYLNKDRGTEIERRSHLIVDFISGMTDDFALEVYQILEGIRIK